VFFDTPTKYRSLLSIYRSLLSIHRGLFCVYTGSHKRERGREKARENLNQRIAIRVSAEYRSLLYGFFAKETYVFREPDSNQSTA